MTDFLKRASSGRTGRTFLIGCLLGVFVAACGSEPSTEISAGFSSGQTGSVAFQVKWGRSGDADTAPTRKAQSPSGNVCDDYGIDTISASVYDGDGILTTASFPCTDHTGVVRGVAAGGGRRLRIEGLVGTAVNWRGEVDGITVSAGQTAPAGDVTVVYIGSDASPPIAVQTFPVNGATGISPDAAVTVTFSEDVVSASITGAGITLGTGASTVSGQVTYDAANYRATFTPDAPLAYSTVYTLTMTTALEDRAGNTPAVDQTWQFTTKAAWYVDGSLPTNGGGQNWSDAFNTIQSAVAAANSGDEIWVKAYVYTIASQSVSINKQVEIYGGFSGTESFRDDRDFEANPTIIDGANLYRCVFVSADATIDGIIIRKGSNADASEARAGGLYNFGATPVIRNCVFDSNIAVEASGQYGKGGAIYNEGGGCEIVNCQFVSNEVGGHGSGYGAAIYNDNCDADIRSTMFSLNRCSNGFADSGGAIYNDESSPTIVDCIFSANKAEGESSTGGAIHNYYSNAVITNCRFLNNEAWPLWSRGGSIYNDRSDPILTNCIFAGNRAIGRQQARGGAIYNYYSNPTIRSSTIYQNTTEEYGVDVPLSGGGMYNDNSAPTITDCILWGNVAESGLQIFDDNSSVTITYSDIDQAGYSGLGIIRKEPFLGSGYLLQADSFCIDTGAPASDVAYDINGEGRPQGSGRDMGADEFLDTDGDGMPDLWELTNGFTVSVDDSAGNIDGDGFTNLTEYRIGGNPNVTTPYENSENRGWWSQDGVHNASDNSTIVGKLGSTYYRTYFIFDLGTVTGSITSAVLRIELTNYSSTDASEYLSFWDVLETTHTTLETGTGSILVYDDLGTGRMYGTMIVTTADVGTIIEIKLNPQAIDDINDALGGTFAIGVNMTDAGGSTDSRIRFSDGPETRIHQLVLGVE